MPKKGITDLAQFQQYIERSVAYRVEFMLPKVVFNTVLFLPGEHETLQEKINGSKFMREIAKSSQGVYKCFATI